MSSDANSSTMPPKKFTIYPVMKALAPSLAISHQFQATAVERRNTDLHYRARKAKLIQLHDRHAIRTLHDLLLLITKAHKLALNLS